MEGGRHVTTVGIEPLGGISFSKVLSCRIKYRHDVSHKDENINGEDRCNVDRPE